jgi:hypothetical protein
MTMIIITIQREDQLVSKQQKGGNENFFKLKQSFVFQVLINIICK